MSTERGGTTDGDPVLAATSVGDLLGALDRVFGTSLPTAIPDIPLLQALWSLPVTVRAGAGTLHYRAVSSTPWTIAPLPPATVVIDIQGASQTDLPPRTPTTPQE
jgi:hypothetical protein